MQPIAEALTLSSLVAGTLEYAIMIRHREERRHDSTAGMDGGQSGDRAVRAHLLDQTRPMRHWTAAGTRFR